MGRKLYTVSSGMINPAFVTDETVNRNNIDKGSNDETNMPERQQWGNDREFLLTCIAMSIGLGNVWRFPFTAYENGGGAFLIPYIIVLLIVGKPLYLLEMILGQFSNRSAVKVWDIAPAFRGIGIAQFIILLVLGSYYCSLTALALFYLVVSFQTELPWNRCRPEWGNFCVDALPGNSSVKIEKNVTYVSSAELYFYKEVLREKNNIDDGIGAPDWRLSIALFVSWLIIFLVIIRGVRSTGKASYFLAIFPYVVLIVLFIHTVRLDGSVAGILYFITPTWEKLLTPTIWYHAVAQCFFSLTVCFGGIVMFASHNRFHHNVYRDAMIVTTLDTFTSLLAGCTIFAILGNLSYELGAESVGSVVRGGIGLAFISYPETIARFIIVPQFFAIVFFAMLLVLGIGSGVGIVSAIIVIVHDCLPKVKYWHVAASTCFCEFLIGLIYVTPGGQFMITFVDYYVTSFIAFLPATFEVIAIAWSYGLSNFLIDIEFMLGRRLSIFWRLCWGIVTPAIIFIIFLYSLINLEPLKYNNIFYPNAAYVIGWILFSIAVVQIPLWMAVAIFKKRHLSFREANDKASLSAIKILGSEQSRRS
ncbi:sodium-dependent nutrient amino acid transporter 1-like isoform X2 [Linepithema humile]|uniref:sodium-dependent nutrient amino acid transporter 1-like isoform X2 n=1 Tax=Linepithema humile TaxID=83485 RepID=UPI000623591A|nr:PREDICTED: sodium-dependent nutrient amino acid transporter 1-like isoform X2 [Linepithema humile]